LKGQQLSELYLSDLVTYSATNATSAGKNAVQVEAILCWTEYYNGTWQPTKTSHVNQPTSIGLYDTTGPASFEASRDLIRIVPAQYTGTYKPDIHKGITFTQPADSLIVAITDTSTASIFGGFLLHNTHSLPIRLEDISVPGKTKSYPLAEVLDPPSPARKFPAAKPYTGTYGDGTFTIGYAPTLAGTDTYTNKILEYTWMPRWVDAQPGLPDAWVAPFIYEDRRYLFYVRTTESFVPIWDRPGFGIAHSNLAESSVVDIPPLVLRGTPAPPVDGEIVAANAAAGGPIALQRYLSTGTTIQAALASPTGVVYSDRLISPTGSVPTGDAVADGNEQGASS
jgi:hypothetical protein